MQQGCSIGRSACLIAWLHDTRVAMQRYAQGRKLERHAPTAMSMGRGTATSASSKPSMLQGMSCQNSRLSFKSHPRSARSDGRAAQSCWLQLHASFAAALAHSDMQCSALIPLFLRRRHIAPCMVSKDLQSGRLHTCGTRAPSGSVRGPRHAPTPALPKSRRSAPPCRHPR